MTRVAIIGNSHVGAYVLARDAIEAAFPSLTLSFFAQPRHSFSSCTYTEDGILSAREASKNGLPTQIDLSQQDHILMVGQRFAIEGLAGLIDDFDILGLYGQHKGQTISTSLLHEFLDFRVERTCDQLTSFIRDDPRCVVSPIPFASDAATGIASSIYTCAHHPAATALIPLWSDTVAHYMAPHRCGLMHQPNTLQSKTGTTPAHLSRAHSLPPDAVATDADYTHMNAQYGLAHFKAYANQWLGLDPQPQTDPPIKEH